MNEAAAKAGASEKRQFLVHIDIDLIQRTKILAIERRVTASSLVQAALAEFLNRNGPIQSGANRSETIPSS